MFVRILAISRGERSAERRELSWAVRARHGSAPCDRRANASRRSTAALARGFRPLAQLQAMLAATWFRRALPAFSHPSAVEAPHAPAVVPEGMMPEAARERIASPRAGAAPRSTIRIASGMRPSVSETKSNRNTNGDESQVSSLIWGQASRFWLGNCPLNCPLQEWDILWLTPSPSVGSLGIGNRAQKRTRNSYARVEETSGSGVP